MPYASFLKSVAKKFPGLGRIFVQLDELRSERDGLRDELIAITSKRNKLRSQRNSLSAELPAITSERNDLRAERDSLHCEIKAITYERNNLRAERDNLHCEIEAITSERNNLRAERDNLHCEIEATSSERNNLRAERDRWRREAEATPLDIQIQAEQLVHSLYRLVLHREPEQNAVSYWMNQIAQGINLNSLLEIFMRSEEFQQLHGRMGLLTPGVDAMEIAKSRQPMFHETAYIVAAEEIASGPETLSSVLVVLRKISLDDFGRFFLTLPNPKYPKLSKLLPAMAPSLLQQQWNGSDGETLLIQTTAFVRSVAWHYAELTGKQLGDARILDFGCGWGRVIRMMYYFAAPDQIYGCDANSEAIRICREARIPGNFEFSDYIPSRVPFMGPFDLIYASSLFMHLSKRVTASMLSCLRNYIANDGLLVVTIRPVEFWEALNLDVEEVKNLSALHRNDGFAFLPHNREQAIDGEIAFGDTSMTCGYLEQTFPQWKPVCIDRSLSDPLQLYLFLQPAG